MKSLLRILALFVFCAGAHAQAVWNIEVHNLIANGPKFNLTGQFTTPSADFTHGGQTITSFTGTFSDDLQPPTPFRLLRLGPMTPSNSGFFRYNNVFYGPSNRPGWHFEDCFDTYGVGIVAGTAVVNISAAIYAHGYGNHSGQTLLLVLVGSVTLDHVVTLASAAKR